MLLPQFVAATLTQCLHFHYGNEKGKCFYRSVWRTGARLVAFVFIMQIELSFCLSFISRSSSSSAQLSSSSCSPLRLLTLFKRVASVLLWCPFVGLWPFSWPFPFPLIYVASRMDSTVLPNFVDCVIFDVMFVLLTRCVVGFEEKHSEFLLRPKRGKKLFSTWSCAFISFVLAHVNAFIKDFLKLSDKNLWWGMQKNRKKHQHIFVDKVTIYNDKIWKQV